MINLATIHHPNLIIAIGRNQYDVRTNAQMLLGIQAWDIKYVLPGGETFREIFAQGVPMICPCSEKLARAFPVGGFVQYLIQDCMLILPEEKL